MTLRSMNAYTHLLLLFALVFFLSFFLLSSFFFSFLSFNHFALLFLLFIRFSFCFHFDFDRHWNDFCPTLPPFTSSSSFYTNNCSNRRQVVVAFLPSPRPPSCYTSTIDIMLVFPRHRQIITLLSQFQQICRYYSLVQSIWLFAHLSIAPNNW